MTILNALLIKATPGISPLLTFYSYFDASKLVREKETPVSPLSSPTCQFGPRCVHLYVLQLQHIQIPKPSAICICIFGWALSAQALVQVVLRTLLYHQEVEIMVPKVPAAVEIGGIWVAFWWKSGGEETSKEILGPCIMWWIPRKD